MNQYDINKINRAIKASRRTRSACRNAAREYSPVAFPDQVIARISSRRKLFNFLDALEYPLETIRSIFHSYGLPVPRDTSLKASPMAVPEERPDWLRNLGQKQELKEEPILEKYNL